MAHTRNLAPIQDMLGAPTRAKRDWLAKTMREARGFDRKHLRDGGYSEEQTRAYCRAVKSTLFYGRV